MPPSAQKADRLHISKAGRGLNMLSSELINMARPRSEVGMQLQAWLAATSTADALCNLGWGKSTCGPRKTEDLSEADLRASAGN